MDSLLRILSSSSCLLSRYSSFPSSSSFSPFEPNEHDIFSTVTNAKTHLSPFQAECNVGILVALPEESDTQNPKVVHRSTLFSSASRITPVARKKKNERTQGHQRKYRSAPVNVPRMQRREFEEEEDDEEEDEMMLAPHEIVDRAKTREALATSSVLEGVGRTLRGRDQTRFRDACLQKTGFLDGFICPIPLFPITMND